MSSSRMKAANEAATLLRYQIEARREADTREAQQRGC